MYPNAKTALSKCLRCGFDDVVQREVERLVRGGLHVAALRVPATVCHHCGERYFDKATVERMEAARKELESGDLEAYQPIGQMLRPTPTP